MPEVLSPARAALVRLSAAIAARDPARLDEALALAAERADPIGIEEALLQSHLFVGFPLALEALLRWRGMGPPAPAPTPEPPESWTARGEAVCARVYGANYPKLRRNVQSIHPDFDRWMVETGYGRVIGRPGLDLATRELCIAALLAVWDAPRQLHSHVRGARNAGASAEEVEAALEIASEHVEPERAASLRALWERVAPAGR